MVLLGIIADFGYIFFPTQQQTQDLIFNCLQGGTAQEIKGI